jgi:hypothetical protein
MELKSKEFRVNKSENLPGDCEDHFAISADKMRIAISDGASQSIFVNEWAEILAVGFVESSPGIKSPKIRDKVVKDWLFGQWLPPLQAQWRGSVAGKTIHWFDRDNFRRGAHATFLGLEFKETPSGRSLKWQAIAVGDSVLFLIRNGRLLKSFPLATFGDFPYYPALLCSRIFGNERIKNGEGANSVRTDGGKCRPGDTLILCTDALAKWFLIRNEAKDKPWLEVCSITNQEQFIAFVKNLRAENQIDDDDTTLVIVDVGLNKSHSVGSKGAGQGE